MTSNNPWDAGLPHQPPVDFVEHEEETQAYTRDYHNTWVQGQPEPETQEVDELVTPESVIQEDELVPPAEVVQPQQREQDIPAEEPKKEEATASKIIPTGDIKLENYKLFNKQVTQQEAIRGEYDPEDKIHKTYDPVYFTPGTTADLKQIGDSDFFDKNTNALPMEYKEAIAGGIDLLHPAGYYESALESETADIKQYVERPEGPIRPFRPQWKLGGNQSLTGLKAIDKIRKALNQGSTITIPLWASGIWLTIKAPSVLDLANNWDAIAQETVDLGRQTGGSIFENTQVVLNKNLMDLVEKLFYSWTLVDRDDGKRLELSDVILVDDLETIAWAIGVCMYPNGYPFTEPCISNMEACAETSTELINLSKIFWVDQNKLTDWQIEFMSNPTTKRSYDEIEKYRSESKWARTNKIRLSDYPFELYLKTPTVREYLDSGFNWVSDLKQGVKDVIPNINENKLNQMIFERAALTTMRGYAHYVKAIVYDDGSRTNNVKDIEESINEMCSIPNIAVEFAEKINKHISDNMVTLIAVPRHICVHCKKDVNEDDKRHPFLIPISALKLFFNLRDRKLQLG